MNRFTYKLVSLLFGEDAQTTTNMELLRHYAAVQIFIISGVCLLLIIGKMIAIAGITIQSIVITLLTLANFSTLIIYRITKSFKAYLIAGCALCFVVILYVHITLGGFALSSGEILWGLAAIIATFIVMGKKTAKILFTAYVSVSVLLFVCEKFLFPSFFIRPIALLGITFGEINAIGISTLVYTTLKVFLPTLELQFARSQELVVNLEASNKTINDAMTELKGAQSLLVQKEKMASLGQLIAGIAHEINTPIGAIKASAQFIRSTLSERFYAMSNDIHALSDGDLMVLNQIVLRSITKKEPIGLMQKRKVKKSLTASFEEVGIDQSANLASLFIEMELYSDENIAYIDTIKASSSIDLLANNAYLLSALYQGADNIDVATEKITKIIFALKSFSHNDYQGEATKAHLEDCIENVLTLYHNALKSGVQIIRNYNMSQKWIMCYPDELNQVWTNIIHNAIHAMKNEGLLTITTTNDDAYVSISFADTGCGIPKENIDRLFEPFYTSKPMGEGTGLGLDISKRIIEKHGGRIEVTSEIGVGSVFTVIIPCFVTV